MPTKASLTVAEAVKFYRRKERLTIEKAAAAAGVHYAVWQRIETGNANPTLSTLEAVAYTLNVPLNSLFTALWPNLEL